MVGRFIKTVCTILQCDKRVSFTYKDISNPYHNAGVQNYYVLLQIWKLMYTYFGIFSGKFDYFVLLIFIYIKIIL